MSLKPFVDSTSLLQVPDALRQRMAEDGYLYLRHVVDPAVLLDLRKQFIEELVNVGWLRQPDDPLRATPAIVPYVEGEEGYFTAYDRIQKLEAFHRLPHHPDIEQVMQTVLGKAAFPHPLAIARLVFPQNEEWSTPPHQDFPNNQGTEELYACWMPLGDCPAEQGALTILEGSHRFGLMPLEFALGAGHRQALLNAEMQRLDWVGGDLQCGDMLIFHSHTVHRAGHNISSQMRLSVDYRFQREGDALTEHCLKPHFQRLTWEEIYAAWEARDIAYYWRNKNYSIEPWNADLHAISVEQEQEAIRVSLKNERKRERLRQDSKQ